MNEIYCIKCNKYRKINNPKISYVFNKTLVLSIIYDRCGSKDEKVFQKEESIEISKILGLFKNIEECYINISLL